MRNPNEYNEYIENEPNEPIDETEKKGAISDLIGSEYQKYLKNGALLLGLILTFLVLQDVDKMFNSSKTIKVSLYEMFLAILLISYYLGGQPNKLRATLIVALVLFLPFNFFQETPKETVNKVSNYLGSSPKKTIDTVTITEEGVYNFKLGPFETIGNWLYVADYLRYSTSTPGKQIVYIKYKDGRPMTKVDRDNVPVGKGAFKYVAGETPISVSMMVVRNNIEEAKQPTQEKK